MEIAVSKRIAWVEEAEATGEVAALYEQQRARSGRVADIVKTFSGRPEALEAMFSLSAVHFGPDAALTRAQREMIATHVSKLLGCHY
jgi:alkylhydroperoxidase family enzyme